MYCNASITKYYAFQVEFLEQNDETHFNVTPHVILTAAEKNWKGDNRLPFNAPELNGSMNFIT